MYNLILGLKSSIDTTPKFNSEYNFVRKAAFGVLLPFCFPTKRKNTGEAKETVCLALGENAIIYSTCKK